MSQCGALRALFAFEIRGRGSPLKPLPRKKLPPDIRSLARGYTDICIKTLGGFAGEVSLDPETRMQAILILFERGWGKPAQPHTGEDGEGDIRITIRNILEGKK